MKRHSLPSEQPTRRREREIRRFCTEQGYRGDLVFEHGHWWLTLPDGSIFDVVDVSGSVISTGDNFALERVS